MTHSRRFAQVDVFTNVPLMGNPVAVVLDGEGLSTEQMQAMAAWTNLSETTFVLPPTQDGADYRVRIFTPKAELPFAGHPTLGTAHAVIEAGLAAPTAGKLVQECAVGLVELTIGANRLSFRLPRYALTALNDPEATAWINAPVKGAAQAVDVGPVWLVAEVDGIAALENLAHDEARLAAYYVPKGWTGATLYAALLQPISPATVDHAGIQDVERRLHQVEVVARAQHIEFSWVVDRYANFCCQAAAARLKQGVVQGITLLEIGRAHV